jgi:hypothetical protein
MRRSCRVASILLIASCFVGAASAQSAQSPVGVWDVIEWVEFAPDGQRTEPYGADPNGMFVYTPNGNLILATTVNPLLSKAGPFDDAALAERARLLVAYYGTYTVNAQGSEIIHNVQVNLVENRVGGALVRPFKVEGNQMTLEWSDTSGARHLRRLRLLESLRP